MERIRQTYLGWLATFEVNGRLCTFLFFLFPVRCNNVNNVFLGMDGRAENNLREEEAGGADAGLLERAGDIQQQVRQKIKLNVVTNFAQLHVLKWLQVKI